MSEEMMYGRPWWVVQHVPWWWKFGIPRDLWVVHEAEIGRFIKENKVNPISQEAKVGLTMGVMRTTSMEKSNIEEPWWWFGGMKAPHLHFKNDVYLLTPGQWNKFSQSILERFQKQLGAVNAVSFEKLMELSDVMSDMPESR